MLLRIIFTLFLIESVYGYGYKYGGLTPCCGKSKWRPIHGISHPAGFSSNNYHSDALSANYGPPVLESITDTYNAPSIEYNPKPVYGPPSHIDLPSFDTHSFGGLSNSLEGLSPPSLSSGYGVPQPTYGPPAPVYGVPFQSYGVPSNGFKNNFHSHGFGSHGFGQNLIGGQQLAHHKVLQAHAHESQLPPELLNPFYKNPVIKDALAKHSWFGPGEKPVLDRETDRISRQEIWKVLSHAGLIKKRR